MLLPTPTNSHIPDPMRSVAFVASSNYVMIGVDSMASGHFFGDRDAFDVNSLVALSDAPQVEIADGAQLAPTHRGVVERRSRISCGMGTRGRLVGKKREHRLPVQVLPVPSISPIKRLHLR